MSNGPRNKNLWGNLKTQHCWIWSENQQSCLQMEWGPRIFHYWLSDPATTSFWCPNVLFSSWNQNAVSYLMSPFYQCETRWVEFSSHNSSTRYLIHWFYWTPSDNAFNSASVEDKVILHCFLLFHPTGQDFHKQMEPLQDKHVSKSLAHVVSV